MLWDAAQAFVIPARSYGWPTTTGSAGEAQIVERTGSYRGRTSVLGYEPVIDYRYSVGGRSYRASTYQLYPGYVDSYAEAERIVAGFPPGSPVTVYYNPANPAEAYLARSMPRWIDYLFNAVFCFLTLGLTAGAVAVALPARLTWIEPGAARATGRPQRRKG